MWHKWKWLAELMKDSKARRHEARLNVNMAQSGSAALAKMVAGCCKSTNPQHAHTCKQKQRPKS